MIDEYWTWEFYGYHSDELKSKSGKPIVARCDDCCQYRVLSMKQYRALCHLCAHRTPVYCKTRAEISAKMKHTDASKRKRIETYNNLSPEEKYERNEKISTWRNNLSPEEKHEINRKRSATMQGVPYEEWTGFASNGEYCEKFDDACRERIRAKYDYMCFACDLPQEENITKNGKHKKLSVHHVDMNKEQGCNGVLWKLVPLCMHCHGKSHFPEMRSRIEYLLDE